MADAITAKIGSKVLKKVDSDSEPVELDIDTVLQGKECIGFYFSAHWCPPCRGFTPKLAEFYEKHKDGLKFEVIFVSSDRDEGSFKQYFGEMPWCALPFSDRATKEKVCNEYGVRGIPCLVLLNKDGSTITLKGREGVASDPEGKNFPWKD